MKIVWEKAKYGFEYGYVNGIQLFCVGYESLGNYSVTTTLPSIKKCCGNSMENAKEISNKILIAWLNKIQG